MSASCAAGSLFHDAAARRSPSADDADRPRSPFAPAASDVTGVRVVGRIRASDGAIRVVEVEAETHGTAKIRVKSEVGVNERLLSIQVVQE